MGALHMNNASAQVNLALSIQVAPPVVDVTGPCLFTLIVADIFTFFIVESLNNYHLVIRKGRRSRVTGFPIGLTLNEGAVIFQHASWGTKFDLTKTIQSPVCVPRIFDYPVVCAISCLVCNDVKRLQLY